MSTFKAFEEIQVGDRALLTRRIEEADVRRFVELTGDDNPLHVDRAYAETTPFKDVVVHGMLGASFLSTLIGTELPGQGALWVSQTLEFLLPVRLGDVLTVSCRVEARHERERLLELATRIENQAGQVVLTGKGVVKVMARPAAPPPRPARPMVALVVGGAGGIGRAICRRLARDGFRVAVGYRGHRDRAEALVQELTAAGGEAAALPGDVADERSCAALVDATVRRFGGLGVVVFAATGPIRPAALEDLAWGSIQEHLDTQVRGAFHLARACAPRLRAQGHGRLVFLGSQVADDAPPPRWTAYTVAKAALSALVRSLAVELGPAGVTVNCVAPGMTDTALVADVPEKARLVLARQAPLRRLATPEDVAGAVAFLASPDADYLTGETLRVNGGQAMR